MSTAGDDEVGTRNPSNEIESPKPKIIVIMGSTGSGKSRLAIDLASQFPIEIINADSMQVYKGLDVLTNKVTIDEQKGVPHHLLGTVDSSVEFTSKDFRDSASLLIDEILSRNHLPVIVGGSNFYIQALVSPFLLDDAMEDDDCCCPIVGEPLPDVEVGNCDGYYSYEQLKILDPIAANRIHPNDKRKVQHYVDLIVRGRVLPSELFRGKLVENWGRIDNSKYDCCFVCVDASLLVLDEYVGQRVDKMITAGLLNEVYDIYAHNADYTRGLRQAIGVREFDDFLNAYLLEVGTRGKIPCLSHLVNACTVSLKADMEGVMSLSVRNLLEEAIEKMRVNTRRLVRRQKRRISRLRAIFSWNVNFVDSTESLRSHSDHTWFTEVVKPSAQLLRSFLKGEITSMLNPEVHGGLNVRRKDLWTRHMCEACGHKVLRGEYEWEQHTQGRSHRKRVSSLKKRLVFGSMNPNLPSEEDAKLALRSQNEEP